jgi:hypothetical protein
MDGSKEQPKTIAGLDLGDKYSYLCLIDQHSGEIVEEGVRHPTTVTPGYCWRDHLEKRRSRRLPARASRRGEPRRSVNDPGLWLHRGFRCRAPRNLIVYSYFHATLET